MFTRVLTDLEGRLGRRMKTQVQGSLVPPATWRGDRPQWARLVAHARLYATCRAVYFRNAGCSESVMARLFDDLAKTAELIGRGDSLYTLSVWLNSAEVRPHPDAKVLRNLIHIIESLDLF